MLAKILQNIGLTEKEAKVYLACLELGPQPVSEIAKKARINRVTAYDILEKLLKKGLVNFVTKEKIKFFNATDPRIVSQETKSSFLADFERSTNFPGNHFLSKFTA